MKKIIKKFLKKKVCLKTKGTKLKPQKLFNSNPTHYNNLPRVSSIVDFVFPFSGENEERFIDWLTQRNIKVSEYMEEASKGGSAIHKGMENYINSKTMPKGKYRNYILGGINAIKELKIKPIFSEKYVSNELYQGTIDLVAKIGNSKYILDWKSWNLSKDIFGITYTPRKDYSKLKKATLQLSLYANILGIKNIGVIHLTKNGYIFYKLNLLKKKEINKILYDFRKANM